MDTQPVWGMILNVPVGRFIAWIVVISSIISIIVAGTIKAYKAFNRVRDLKESDEEKTKMLRDHDEAMKQINERLESIQDALNQQKEVNLKQVRYQIVHTCDDALSVGYITAGKLKSLEELYEEYTNIFHGNGYVKTLMIKVRKLPVRGSLDE